MTREDEAKISIESHVIMFMDIHDCTFVIEKSETVLWGVFLQDVYETLGRIIVAYKGEIIKYMGDAILCIFSAESGCTVIECAKTLRKAYSDLITHKRIQHDSELEIGVSSGDVEVGMFGHPSLRQKDIFGDAVAQATVIGHHRGIAITKSVYDTVAGHYKTVELPSIQVKWRDESLRKWEIVE